MKLVVFLQNAWSPVYAGRKWPRESWLRALSCSRSGQRLIPLIDSFNDCENTTESVAPTPSGICPADPTHIRKVISDRKPDTVIACGKQAEEALRVIWPGPMMAVPHPACRVVTTSLYLQANGLLVDGFSRRIALRQRRGEVHIENI